MREYIDLIIKEHANGYSVRLSTTHGVNVDEIHEERLDALRVIERWFNDEIIKELERKVPYAATM